MLEIRNGYDALKSKSRAIFLDRDGTLGGAGGFCHPNEFEFYDFTFEAIKLVNQME